MKPFDLEAAKAGEPVCTREGRKARIICFDRVELFYTIVALIETEGFPYVEKIVAYTNKGRRFTTGEENPSDLMMATD